MQLSIQISEDKIRKEAEALANAHATQAAKDFISSQFRKEIFGVSPNHSQSAGPMNQLITKKIDDLFLSEDFQKKIDKVIDSYLDQAMKEACEKRVQHHINKQVFSKDITTNNT